MRRLSEELENALKIDVKSCRKNSLYGNKICGDKVEGEYQKKEKMQAHKEQLLVSVRNIQAVQRPKKRIGFFEFLFRQIPYLGKDLWMTQGFASFAAFGILYLSLGGDLKYLSIRHVPLLLGIMAIVLVMASVPLMLRPYQYQMHEIEMTTRMALPRLLTAELVFLVIEYLVVFGFCAGVTTSMAGLPVMKVILYFIFPLLLAGTGCVELIRRTGRWDEITQRMGVCEGYCICLAGILILLNNRMPALYDNVGAWAVLATVMLPLSVLSVHVWIKESWEVSEKEGIV